jgi:hypothetical protein
MPYIAPAFSLINGIQPKVWVNQYNLLNNNVPFGGKKQSGIGEQLLRRTLNMSDFASRA